jgi:hypothetical protein
VVSVPSSAAMMCVGSISAYRAVHLLAGLTRCRMNRCGPPPPWPEVGQAGSFGRRICAHPYKNNPMKKNDLMQSSGPTGTPRVTSSQLSSYSSRVPNRQIGYETRAVPKA